MACNGSPMRACGSCVAQALGGRGACRRRFPPASILLAPLLLPCRLLLAAVAVGTVIVAIGWRQLCRWVQQYVFLLRQQVQLLVPVIVINLVLPAVGWWVNGWVGRVWWRELKCIAGWVIGCWLGRRLLDVSYRLWGGCESPARAT